MITRAIIEEVVDLFSYRVRIPIFDRIESATHHTSFENLLIAKASVSKGSNNQFQKGDVVFVAFENNDLGSPVIIGHLYRNALLQDQLGPIIEATNLTITGKASLPITTTIGDLSYNQLFYLSNVESDIQAQINDVQAQINDVESDVQAQNTRVPTETTLGSIKEGNGLKVSNAGVVSFSPVQTSGTIAYLDQDTINYCRGNRFECLPMSNIVSASIASKNFNDINWSEPQFITINNDVFNTSTLSGFTIGDNSDNIKGYSDDGEPIYYDPETEYIKKEYRISFELSMTNIYAHIQKLYFWVTTNGTSIKCLVYGKRGQDLDYLSDPLASTTLSGWSGSNLLPLDIIINGSATNTNNSSHYNKLKFVFESGPRQIYKDSQGKINYRSYPAVMKIAAYGIDAWTHLNNMSHFDHMYVWDNNCNVTFPKNIKTNNTNGLIDETDDKSFVTIGYLKSKNLI